MMHAGADAARVRAMISEYTERGDVLRDARACARYALRRVMICELSEMARSARKNEVRGARFRTVAIDADKDVTRRCAMRRHRPSITSISTILLFARLVARSRHQDLLSMSPLTRR